MKTYTHGFTLVELMFVILVMAILIALAAPSFDDTIRRNAVDSQQGKLLAALNNARQSAVNMARSVSVCRSTNGTTCATATGSWTGWITFTDQGTAGAIDGSDKILVVENTVESAVTITMAAADGTAIRFVQFGSGGALTSASASSAAIFKFCDRKNQVQTARAVIVTSSGRSAPSAKGSGGIHMNTLSSPAAALTCP